MSYKVGKCIDFRYKDKRYEERELYQRLLDFSKERNVTLHVTTQAQRKAGEAIIVIGKHVGEAYDKFRTVDTCFTLTQSEAMYKKSKFYLFHAGNMVSYKKEVYKVKTNIPDEDSIILNVKGEDITLPYVYVTNLKLVAIFAREMVDK